MGQVQSDGGSSLWKLIASAVVSLACLSGDYAWGDHSESRLVLNMPLPAVDLLDIHLASARIEHRSLFVDPMTSDTHLLLVYVSEGPFQLLDANLTRGSVRVTDGTEGRPGPQAAIMHANGKLYLGSSDPGFLMEYSVKSGESRQIRKLSDKGAQWIEVGDDGALYIGEAVQGRVERFDPSSESWEDLGIMDDPGPPYYRYAYSLGADGRFVYVAMGQNPWYLIAYDRQKKSMQSFWKDRKRGQISISRGKRGGWYVDAGDLGWFQTQEGTLIQLDGVPEVIPRHLHGGICSDSTLSLCNSSFDVDLSRAIPTATNGGVADVEIGYRRVPSEKWQVLRGQVRVAPLVIRRLISGSGRSLLGITGTYGPVVSIDLKSKSEIRVLGFPQRSLYDAVLNLSDGAWYLVGYPSATLRYDPSESWTLNGNASPSSSAGNPRDVPGHFGKYHYYVARDIAGRIYVGAHHERNSDGGEVGWYDPATGTNGNLRAPFIKYDVRDLKPALGGRAMIYSSVSLPQSDGTMEDALLFVIDVTTKQVVRAIAPLRGVGKLDKVVETSPGIIFGVADSECYAVDINTGKVLYRRSLGGAFGVGASQDRRLVLGPDGLVWCVLLPSQKAAAPFLARIDPRDGSIERVMDVAGLVNVVFLPSAGEDGYDAVLYGSSEVKVVRKILSYHGHTIPSGAD